MTLESQAAAYRALSLIQASGLDLRNNFDATFYHLITAAQLMLAEKDWTVMSNGMPTAKPTAWALESAKTGESK